jgi:squalene/oxidosqualene cyclase-like protein
LSSGSSLRGSESAENLSVSLERSITRALTHLTSLQADSGAWLGDYGGPMFLLPMYMATCRATGVEIPRATLADMVRYLRNTQRGDGGFGLHVESHSYVFTSAIIYAALRLSEVPADDAMLVRLRAFLRANGGPLAAAPWGKFLLALLNLYDYRGLSPVPPELWIAPESLPVHPSRMWCHTRMVYLPMSYLYGVRLQMPVDARVREIRAELYDQPYEHIDWQAARERIADSDNYRPVSAVMRVANRILQAHESSPIKPLRARALRFVLDQIDAEDRNTDYVCLGPVNKLYHLWVWHHARPGGREFSRHVARLPEYLWRGESGTKMQGYHSSQLWDTAFAAQAIIATGRAEQHKSTLEQAQRFITQNQVTQDLPQRERNYRDPTKGGFCFSAKDNGWIVSDCTAEGLRAALQLRDHVREPLSPERCADAVEYLLWSQMRDGGWASYEPARGPAWLERLNPAACFGDIMIDYSYVECTAACMLALSHFSKVFPEQRRSDIARAITRGADYLLGQQRSDGSFEGSWGICFTYGTWFGIEGLRAAGLTLHSRPVRRAVSFLERHQLPDGGWGETAESNLRRSYVHAETGQAVMTAWALLGLCAAEARDSRALLPGAHFLIARQNQDGSYPPERIAGMFNKTCAIHYDNYLNVFPLWALGRVRQLSAQPGVHVLGRDTAPSSTHPSDLPFGVV